MSPFDELKHELEATRESEDAWRQEAENRLSTITELRNKLAYAEQEIRAIQEDRDAWKESAERAKAERVDVDAIRKNRDQWMEEAKRLHQQSGHEVVSIRGLLEMVPKIIPSGVSLYCHETGVEVMNPPDVGPKEGK